MTIKVGAVSHKFKLEKHLSCLLSGNNVQVWVLMVDLLFTVHTSTLPPLPVNKSRGLSQQTTHGSWNSQNQKVRQVNNDPGLVVILRN